MVENKPGFSLCAECKTVSSLVEQRSKAAILCDRCRDGVDREVAEILRTTIDTTEEIEVFEFREIDGFLARVASWFLGLHGAAIFKECE